MTTVNPYLLFQGNCEGAFHMKSIFLALGLVIFCSSGLLAQSKSENAFLGTWRGTSLCQVKHSPCHDEKVVYYITRKNGTDSFYIRANKIVNGVEEEMGILPFVYNSSTNELNSSAYGTWNFKIEKDKIKGTLIENGRLYRIVELSKQQ